MCSENIYIININYPKIHDKLNAMRKKTRDM